MTVKAYLLISMIPVSFLIGYLNVVLSDSIFLNYFVKNILTKSIFIGLILMTLFFYLIFRKRS